MAKTIDFETGMWGHKFHASTWTKLPDREGWFARLRDRWTKARRFSVLVHSRELPEPGDLIRYPANTGGAATARIEQVEQMRDPADMFTLFLIRDHKLDMQFNVVRA